MKNIVLFISVALQLIFSQYQVGDIVSNLTAPICSNGDGELNLYDYYGENNGGENYVILISIFASWCTPCYEEAPIINSIYEEYNNQNFIVIGSGFGWDMPYSCEGWNEQFELSFPLIDDDDGNGFPGNFSSPFFNNVIVPYNIIIDHTMTIRYMETGFDESNIIENIEYYLNLISDSQFGDINQDGSVDIFDILTMVGIIIDEIVPTEQELNDSDLNNDMSVDVFDILTLIDIILNN